jgi:glycosyltransferase involved in cell wall biosynthesis
MARILLIGRGPLPTAETPQLGFSQLRTQAFLDALQGAGHEVRLVLLVPEVTAAPLESWAGVVDVREEGPGWVEQTQALAADADIVVSAGPYNPGRLATAVAGQRPLWADVPGDPSAELSALARVTPGGLSEAQIAAAHAGVVSVLGRADGISVISDAQRHATLGQLGLMGRLLYPETAPMLATVPISGGFAQHAGAQTPRDAGLVIALAGAFNPWVDVEGLIVCLSTLLEYRADARVVCTGGGLPGFYEAGFERFKTWAASQTRVTVHGWLPHAEMLTVLQQAHIGLSMDAIGPEPELGSRTRLLLYAELGLAPASTVRCDLTKHWAAQGALIPLPFGHPAEAGKVLAEATVDEHISSRAAALCPTSASVCQPLVDWCSSPQRCAAFVSSDAVLAAELVATKDQLAQIYESPTWSAMNRLHGLGQLAVDRFRVRSE